jgi:putative ABC transport system substrate-binding protein
MDVLWMVADSTVYTPRSTEFILQYTLGHQIPFVGLSAKYVKAGALFAVSWDYTDLGEQAGELAHQILAGKTPAELAVATPRKLPLVLNMKSARSLGVKIPRKVIEGASEVYE